jgi:hypothetical protein
MGHTVDPKTITNRQILEGLWALGVDPNQLSQIDVNMSPVDFLARLHDSGINPDQTTKARDLVAWRPDTGNVNDFLKTLQMEGVPPDQIRQIIGDAQQRAAGPGIRTAGQPLDFMGLGGGFKDLGAVKLDPGLLTEAASAVLGPQQISQAKIKTGQTQGMTQDQWNPFRDDRNSVPAAVSTEAPVAGDFAPSSDKYRGTIAPAVKANTPPASGTVPAAAATTAGVGGGAGGGPNNQPPAPATWSDDQIKTFIKQNFGANAYFVDIPEVWSALKDVVKSGKGINGLEPALETTSFWKQNTASARNWFVKEKSDPAQTAADVATQTQAVLKTALDQGITIDPTRASEIAQSYLRYGWTQQDLAGAISAEWHYDPSSKNQASVVGQMKNQARNWLVPLSDQAIQTWGQGILAGTTTQDQFGQYLRDNAKSLLPQLSDLIDKHQGDPNFTVDHFVDPYRQTAAQTLGVQPDQVDFSDPKWRKALDQVDPKTGQRRIMSLSEWSSALKTDPTYGYDKTQNGVQDGLNLAGQLKTSLGF